MANQEKLQSQLFGETKPEKIAGPFGLDDEQKKEAIKAQEEFSVKGPLSDLPILDKLALLTTPVPIAGDIVGLAADAKAVSDDPNLKNILMAGVGALPFIPAGLGRLKELGGGKFKAALDKEKGGGAFDGAGNVDQRSRAAIVEMDADEFLKLAESGTDSTKADRVRRMMDDPEQEFDSLPLLSIDDTTDNFVVTGHEGRHRAREMKNRGFSKIPVKLQRTIGRGDLKEPKGRLISETERQDIERNERMKEIRRLLDGIED